MRGGGLARAAGAGGRGVLSEPVRPGSLQDLGEPVPHHHRRPGQQTRRGPPHSATLGPRGPWQVPGKPPPPGRRRAQGSRDPDAGRALSPISPSTSQPGLAWPWLQGPQGPTGGPCARSSQWVRRGQRQKRSDRRAGGRGQGAGAASQARGFGAEPGCPVPPAPQEEGAGWGGSEVLLGGPWGPSPLRLSPRTPQADAAAAEKGERPEAGPAAPGGPHGGHTHLLEPALPVQPVDLGQQGPPVRVPQLEDAHQRLHQARGALSQEPGRAGLQWARPCGALEARDPASAGGLAGGGAGRAGPEVGARRGRCQGLRAKPTGQGAMAGPQAESPPPPQRLQRP